MARGGLISHRYGVVYLGRGGVGWGKGMSESVKKKKN